MDTDPVLYAADNMDEAKDALTMLRTFLERRKDAFQEHDGTVEPYIINDLGHVECALMHLAAVKQTFLEEIEEAKKAEDYDNLTHATKD